MDSKKNCWWQYAAEEIRRVLETDLKSGLNSETARKRLEFYGLNQLPEQKRISPLKIFLNQFASFIVWVLIGATIVSFALGEWIDALAIAVIVILNAILGFFQEYQAEKSLAALRQLSSPTSKVIRNGSMQNLSSKELVQGDLVLLEAGDRVPADGRIVHAVQLSAQEAALTGESVPVPKAAHAIQAQELSIGDRKNMVFMGTVIVTGKGHLVVTETGLQTELGKIAAMLEAGKEEKTPLELKLAGVGRRLVLIFLGVVVLVFALGLFRGKPLLEMIITSLSLAVAAIPEGLPAVVTVSLALGVRKMAKRNALVRRLASVETLGCATVICTDKTGTLTQNEMTVSSIWVNGDFITVKGVGYIPDGEFSLRYKSVNPQEVSGLIQALKIGALCNSANLYESDGGWKITGDPTEGALLSVARKAGLNKDVLEAENSLLDELPFDSERKRMSMLRRTENGPIVFTKGAPDVMLQLSETILINGKETPLNDEIKKQVAQANAFLASKALRVLGVAYRKMEVVEEFNPASENHLVFVGLLGMMDLPRPEAKKAIEICNRAGIHTVMITGDHRETAVAVAKELGLMQEKSVALSGEELNHMSDEDLKNRVRDITVYARTSAEHKLRIVRAWKSHGDIVAMTGDGVNDAPAIKEADIGVAMGITGTDVTKEASDMVITDDNFASIVNAVEEGRGIYDNIIKFVNYLLSANIAEILIIFIAMLIGMRDPAGNAFVSLSAVQILWVNLVSDGLPAIALGMDPLDSHAMSRVPRNSHESILSMRTAPQLFLISILIALGTLAACHYGLRESAPLAQTMALTTLVVLELVWALVIRFKYHIGIFSNPFLILAVIGSFILQLLVVYFPPCQKIFGTVALGFQGWGVILVITVSFSFLGMMVNKIFRKNG